jgi:D-alanyl-D-alanine carboxypeptidase
MQSMLNNKQKEIYKNLGISPNYGEKNNLKFYKDATDLMDVGPNVVGVNQRLSKKTALQWGELLKAAAEDNISILIVSGFRSFNYQANLIQKKLEKGIDIKDILKVNAPPGFSQHHSGRAIDVATKGYPPLTEKFEESDAFIWLERNANSYSFYMPYTKKNEFGIIYEPWHWFYDPFYHSKQNINSKS